MFKSLISPIQAWLLSQGRCVGCSEPLANGLRSTVRGQITTTCKCGRIFIFDDKKNTYRRALFSEV